MRHIITSRRDLRPRKPKPFPSIIDPEIKDVIIQLNELEGVSTTHSCSGMHRGARDPHVIIAFDSPSVAEDNARLLEEFRVRRTRPPGRKSTPRRTYIVEPRVGQSAEDFWGELRGRLER